MRHAPHHPVRAPEDRSAAERADPGLAYVLTDMAAWTDCEERARVLGVPMLCEAGCFCPHAASPGERRRRMEEAA